MPRLRDYAAEYRARIARAEARGLTRRQARGHARTDLGELPVSRLYRPVRARPQRPRRTTTAGGDLIVSLDTRFVRAELRSAAKVHASVAIYAVFDTNEGPRGKWLSRAAAAGLAGDVRPVVKGDGKGTIHRPGRPLDFQMVIGTAAITRDINPVDVLDLADYYADLWDAIYAIWNETLT